MPFDAVDENGITGDVGIIVVQSMLFTGFDAPIEQVMYLDTVIKNHNLLQAIARVNRKAKNKNCGFVIDYVGVAKHLREALSAYEDKDIAEILEVVKDDGKDIDELKYTLLEIREFLKKLEIKSLDYIDEIVDELADEETRNDFIALFKKLTKAIDRVLPKTEALKYLKDLKTMGFISQTAANRYRDSKLSLKDVSKKVRTIIEEHLITNGVDPKIPPLPILSEEFKEQIKSKKSPRAKAEELTHGIREYINNHAEEDPELYERLAEKLEKLLDEYKNNWDVLAEELEKLLEEIRRGREGEKPLDLIQNRVSIYGVIEKEIFGVKDIFEIDNEDIDNLINVTRDIIERIKTDTKIVDFGITTPSKKQLRTFIASHLLTVFRQKAMLKRKELSQKALRTLLSYLREDKDMSIEIDEIIRSNRRTIALVVTADAKLIVRAPYNTSTDYIKDLVEKKGKWITEKKQAIARRNEVHKEKQFTNGEGLCSLVTIISWRFQKSNSKLS